VDVLSIKTTGQEDAGSANIDCEPEVRLEAKQIREDMKRALEQGEKEEGIGDNEPVTSGTDWTKRNDGNHLF
jgi:hypothetical protein